MNAPGLETSSFFAEHSASDRTTLGARTRGTRLSGSREGRWFGVRVRVLALRPPTVTHPDALHHGDVLILVRLEGDPACAGGPAHGCFCPCRALARTPEHFRPHAHTRAWTYPDACLARREQGHDPKKQGEGAGPQLPPPPVTLHNEMPPVGGRYKRPASTLKGHPDWLFWTRMLWQQVVFDRVSGAPGYSGNCSLDLAPEVPGQLARNLESARGVWHSGSCGPHCPKGF